MESEITIENDKIVQTQVIKTDLAEYIAQKRNQLEMLQTEAQNIISELEGLIE